MSVQRFFGANNREAMARVRAALGDDALILANRPTGDGVEILALTDLDAGRIAGSEADGEHGGPFPDTSADTSELGERLLREMTGMRLLLDRRRSDPAREDSARNQVWRRLRAAGFGRALSETVLTALPERETDMEAWLSRELEARLAGSRSRRLGEAGVVALVGPTGVGKTTTAAKLAARHAMTHGPHGVALVSTDNYRIGAHHQLRLYAELLGVDLYVMEPGQSMRELAPLLSDKQLVIIDTVGLSQRDERLGEQVRRLCGGPAVRPVLLLNAASQPETLDEVVASYRTTASAYGVALDDAIITKEDEASRLGPVLDVLMRHRMQCSYVSHGQRVPEDLVPARASALVAKALARAPAEGDQDGRAPWVHQLMNQGRALGAALATLRRWAPGFRRLEQAWGWRVLSSADQRRHLDAMEGQSRGPVAALCWQGGGHRPHDVCGLDGGGLPLADVFTRLPAGDDLPGVLARGRDRLGAGVHLLTRLPDTRTWHWLDQGGQLWASRARANSCVWHAGERRPLRDWWAHAERAGSQAVRHRGRAVRAGLRRLPVATRLNGGPGLSLLLEAWFAELRDTGNGALLARRYWLLPAGLDQDIAVALVGDQLRNDELPTLTERAASLLTHASPGAPAGEVAGLLANGLAALACRLESEEQDWALEVRAQLLNLADSGRRRGARPLLEALVTLLSTRDALREIGAPALVAT